MVFKTKASIGASMYWILPRTYKKLIETAEAQDNEQMKLVYLRDMIAETTDWYVQNFNKEKRLIY